MSVSISILDFFLYDVRGTLYSGVYLSIKYVVVFFSLLCVERAVVLGVYSFVCDMRSVEGRVLLHDF